MRWANMDKPLKCETCGVSFELKVFGRSIPNVYGRKYYCGKTSCWPRSTGRCGSEPQRNKWV